MNGSGMAPLGKRSPDVPPSVKTMVARELRPQRTIEWPNKARLAVALTFDYHGGQAAPTHPTGQTDYLKASTYQFGPRKGIWHILDTLDRYGIKATFNTCGATAEEYPETVREIKLRGHELAGLTYLHEEVWNMDLAQERTVTEMALSAIEKASGERPVGWRTPDSRISENTLQLLSEAGLVWDSSLLNDDLPYALEFGQKVLVEIPFSGLLNDMSYCGFPYPLTLPGDVITSWEDDFEVLYRESKDSCRMMVLCLHPLLTGRPALLHAFDRFLTRMSKFEGLWFARCSDIATWWTDHEYWI